MERLHLEGAVIGLGVVLIGALFYALVLIGTEISRTRQQHVDGVRLKDLMDQDREAQEILSSSERLWRRIHEDRESLQKVTARLASLKKEDDERNLPE